MSKVPLYKQVSPGLSPYDVDVCIWQAAENLHRVAELMAETVRSGRLEDDVREEADKLLTELEVQPSTDGNK